MFVCVYIYIYIYMCVCVWGGGRDDWHVFVHEYVCMSV